MGNLTRKKIRVRGKSGKTYMRSAMMKADNPKSSLAARSFKYGVRTGALSGAGMYAGALVAHKRRATTGIAHVGVGSLAGTAAGHALHMKRDKTFKNDFNRRAGFKEEMAVMAGSLLGHVGGAVTAAGAHVIGHALRKKFAGRGVHAASGNSGNAMVRWTHG